MAQPNRIYQLLQVLFISAALSTGYMMNRPTSNRRESLCKIMDVPDGFTMPRGGVNVDSIRLLGQATTMDLMYKCVYNCCQLGPEACQYLWVIKEHCYSISCPPNSSHACDPVNMPFPSEMGSIYVAVDFSANQLATNSKGNTHHEDNHHHEELGNDSENTDLPPVANAGPDVIIIFPENTVTLYGNGSTDDKGISSYLWQLTAEDHLDHAMLINPTLPVLHVLDLTPGNYTFTLLVTDESGQMSTDTVDVCVLAEPEYYATNTTPSLLLTSLPPPLQEETSPPDRPYLNAKDDPSADTIDVITNRSNVLKVVIPVLASVAIVLIISALIITASFCLCENNRRKMKHLYRYKRLPETIEKT